MVSMKYNFLIASFIISCGFSSYSFDHVKLSTKMGTVDCIRIVRGDLKDEQALFVKTFAAAYADIPLQTLGITDKSSFLASAFSGEVEDLHAGKPVAIFSAKINDTVVGYISFEQTPEGKTVYIRQLAVDPEFKGQGIGKSLVLLCQKYYPDAEKIILATRRVNQEARGFYTALGFNETTETPHGLNPERYVGYEQVIK